MREQSKSGQIAIAQIAAIAVANQGSDSTGSGGHLADAIVAEIGDVEIASGIEVNAVRGVKRRVGGKAGIARISAGSVAGYGGNYLGRTVDETY